MSNDSSEVIRPTDRVYLAYAAHVPAVVVDQNNVVAMRFPYEVSNWYLKPNNARRVARALVVAAGSVDGTEEPEGPEEPTRAGTRTIIDTSTWAIHAQRTPIPHDACERCGTSTSKQPALELNRFEDDRMAGAWDLCDACESRTCDELDAIDAQEPASTPQEPVSPPQAGSWGTGPNTDPLTDHDTFSAALAVAIDAFCESLAESYPECVTGDVAPDVDETFFRAARRFSEEWIRANHPTHQPKPFTVVTPARSDDIHYRGTVVRHVEAINADAAAHLAGPDYHRSAVTVFAGHISQEG